MPQIDRYVARANPCKLPKSQRPVVWGAVVGGLIGVLLLGAAVAGAVLLSGAMWLRILVAAVLGVLGLVACLVSVTLGFVWLGYRRLGRLEYEINPDGVSQIRPRQITVPWDAVAQMSVTARAGQGLRVEIDSVTDRKALTIFLDYLDVPPEGVVRAIRHYSGGQFPDR